MITVLMPVWDTPGDYLWQAALSCGETDMVIVDDGSTNPDTHGVLYSALRSANTLVVRQLHQGLGPALNRGIQEMSADGLIARMDADDVMLPGRLATQVAYMETHPHVDVCSGQMELIGPDGSHIETTESRYDPSQPIADQYCVHHPTVMYRKSSFEQYGYYDDNDWRGEDYRLWKRWDEQGATFHVMPDVFIRRRVWPGQWTFSRSEYLQRIYKQWETSRTVGVGWS